MEIVPRHDSDEPPLVSELQPMKIAAELQSNPEAQQPNKRRRKKSIVWEHFTVEPVSAGYTRACCKQCKKSFAYITGSKLAGTSHLKRHISLGICPVTRHNQEKNGGNPGAEPPRRRAVPASAYGPSLSPFDQALCNNEMARMMIQHEYPLNMVEHAGFATFARALQPRFSMPNLDAIEDECVAVYLTEKQNLMSSLSVIQSRVSIAVEPSPVRTHVVLTAQFIDPDWTLRRRVLALSPSADRTVASCLTSWNLDGKLFAVTFPDFEPARNSDGVQSRRLLTAKNPSQLVVGSCYARVLRRLTEEAIGSAADAVSRVRDVVSRAPPGSGRLVVDEPGRWDSTYRMLSAAREVLSDGEWATVENLCFYLRLFVEAAAVVAAAAADVPPTANAFFHELWKMQVELSNASGEFAAVQATFDAYWRECCLVVAAAVVMDPRFKMKLVDFSFRRIYGDGDAGEWIKAVDDGIHGLFDEYLDGSGDRGRDSVPDAGMVVYCDGGDGLSDFDLYISEVGGRETESELEQYLMESLLPREPDFDVLGWWKLNRMKYPVLSRMACDLLSVPISTVVGSRSVFSTADRAESSGYWSSLRPLTLEALVCARDWLRHSGDAGVARSSGFSNAIVKMEY